MGQLARAIESVNQQDYEHLDLVIIDNASNQPLTAEDLPTERPFRIFRNAEVLSASVNRNLGVRHATGDIVSFLDDDDYLLPGKFTAHAAAFAQNPDADFVYSDTRHVGRHGKTLTIAAGPPELIPFLHWRHIHMNALSVKKPIFDRLAFNEAMGSFGDVEFIGRMMRDSKGVHVPELHAIWLRDGRQDQITRRNWRRAYDNWRILCREFDPEITSDRTLRRFYHRKMLALSLMFVDMPGALTSLSKLV